MLAQLLAIPPEICGQCLNPEHLVLEFPEEDAEFGTLLAEMPASEFSPLYQPVRIAQDDSDNVFVISLLLYRMLTGQMPDLRLAQVLLVRASGENSVPFLNVPSSSLNPLLARMSDMNPDTRISRRDALDWLAEQFCGSAVIHIVEQETMTELERIELPLNSGTVIWKPAPVMQYGTYRFYPEETQERKIDYRVMQEEYICYVHAEYTPLPEYISIRPDEGTFCFGLDFGAFQSRITRLDSMGQMSELSGIPSVIAYKTADSYVCGEEAVQLCRNGDADLIYCFRPCADMHKSFSVLADNHSVIQETAFSAGVKLMSYLCGKAKSDLQYEPDASCAVIAVPAGSPPKSRTAFRQEAEQAGFRPVQMISAPEAIVTFWRMYEKLDGNILILDAGDGMTDICLIPCRSEETAENLLSRSETWPCGKSTDGGLKMTELLFENILQMLNSQYALNLYQKQNSGLNASQFEANLRQIRETAEQLKHALSFRERAEAVMILYTGQLEKKTVRIGFTRSQYQNLTTPVMQGIRQTIQQVLTGNGLSVQDVSTVLLTGSASLTPAVRETAEQLFKETDAEIQYLNYTMSPARGSALFAGMLSHAGRNLSESAETPEDLGIITADAVRSVPVFQTLIPAGTPFTDGSASCEYALEVSPNDMEQNGFCILRMYQRPRGMEHIRSTLDPGGEAIRYIGKFSFRLPEIYDMSADKLILRISIDTEEQLTVQISHYRKGSQNQFARVFRKLTGKPEDGWMLLESSVMAEFISAT